MAGPEIPLEVGAVVSMPEGMGMENFTAPSLDRTFDAILFVDWFKVVDEELRCIDPKEELAKRGADPHAAGMDANRPPVEMKFHGKVLETVTSGGYTYAQIDTCGDVQWIAGPFVPLKVGEFIKSPEGMVMNNFSSPTLGRAFETIYFVPSIGIAPSGPSCG